jgi:hypothetical protein
MMPQYLLRFAELYERQGRQVEIMDNKLWVNYGRMIVPIGPINMDYSISEEQAHRLMKKVPGSLMVRYTHGYKASSCEEWYAVICDEFKDLGAFHKKHRWEIKKGLESCTIRQVDAGFIAEYGYDVYLSAFSRYQGVIKPIERNDFIKLIGTTKDFDDIYDYWGAFYKDKLIAYMVIAIYGDEEADISVGKFNPEYLQHRPSDALVYTVSQYYLQNESLPYLNAGLRNIYHKTTVQHYLLGKFPFKKIYLYLGVTYNYILHYFLKATFPLRRWLSQVHQDMRLIYMLEEIRKKCKQDIMD